MTFTALTDTQRLKQPRKPRHLLFVAPLMSREGLWRMLMLANALDRHPNYACIVTQVIPEEAAGPFSKLGMDVTEDQVRWADYILFPFTTQDLAGIFRQCKILNPGVKCCFSLDYHFQQMPQSHPHYPFYFDDTQDHERALVSVEVNIKNADLVFVANVALKLIFEKLYNIRTIQLLPLLVDPVAVEQELKEAVPEQKKKGCIRIVVSGEQDALAPGLANISEVIRYLHKKLQGCEIIMIDQFADEVNEAVWTEPPVSAPASNPNPKANAKANQKAKTTKSKTKAKAKSSSPDQHITGSPISISRPLPVTTRFGALHALLPDLAIIPSNGSLFHQSSDTYCRWLELAYLGCPAIMYNLPFYQGILKDTRDYGLRAASHHEWLQAIDAMADPAYRRQMGTMARDYVMQYWTFNEQTIKYFEKVFI